ncbi:conserved Plasmodium protein, unknown function [Plasmodium gallinaceum]|uniref:Uncharacterized protein n=1 Tax=Plasmodium gallinaceum TaxID=5849 RepID=A0A1J1GYY0_PLAGA|nr:conserved Plasmodium protein, unknown function [Plasmodium gallinaceum]CRG96512.1 conserved Plasmodium protein, unknown function [Plasmodium gallinaceum]
MKEKLLEDALEEYRKIHKKNYEERILKENKLNEELKNEELTKEIIKNDDIYKQLQIEKDKEYSKQYYYEINNLQSRNNRSNNNSYILDNYTERLIDTPHSYLENIGTDNLLDTGGNITFTQRIRNFFLINNPRHFFVCTTFQVICNISVLILVIIFIVIFGYL